MLVVPLLDTRTLLLAREYATGTDRYELGFPRASSSRGKTRWKPAGREIREEIGFGARDLKLVRKVSLAPGYIQHETHLVLARDLYRERVQGDEPEPIRVVSWGPG